MLKLAGYAAKYSTPAIIAGLFEETIAPGAFREAVARDDVRALWNHDRGVVLGRKKSGTLRLSEDAIGLYYEVTLNPDDPAALGVGARVSRGDVTGSSFAFGPLAPDDEEWFAPSRAGGLPRRILRRLTLLDVSPVTFPAYEAATVSAARTDVSRIAVRERLQLQLRIAQEQAWQLPARGL